MDTSNDGLTGIIPFTYIGGRHKAVGSSFLRADGLVANADDFRIWKHGNKYNSLIFQKAYWKEMMQFFKGPKILDLCDPDWMTGGIDLIEAGNLVHAVTCSSEDLTAQVKKYFPGKPVWHVPDRLNLKAFPPPRDRHTGKAKNILWFGFINNAHALLDRFAGCIKESGLDLTIMADFAYSKDDQVASLNPRFIKYDPLTAYLLIREHDIVLNPRSGSGIFKYKSNNKTIISWQLGCPVAETADNLKRLLDPGQRNEQLKGKDKLIAEEYDVKISAHQYRSLIELIKTNGMKS